MINSKIPGLLTQWKAPFEDQIPALRRRGKLTLTMVNPTGQTLKLPKEIPITEHQQAKFVKQIGTNDNEAMLVLGPTTSSKMSALDKTGTEVNIRKLNITKLERDVVKKAEYIYSDFVKSEDILLKA